MKDVIAFDINQGLTNVRQMIDASINSANRQTQSVTLLAVSKTQPADNIITAYQSGQRAFGENYAQEAREKQKLLATLGQTPDIEWHFIGPIQSNKTREIASYFSWVHSIDRFKIAKRLSEQRPNTLAPLNVCIQVNLDHEISKSGLRLEELSLLANDIQALPNLTLRGLMAIPAKRDNKLEQRAAFEQLREALSTLQQQLPDTPLDTLSMGMSDDADIAIAAGATIVRVGSAIFGPRLTNQ